MRILITGGAGYIGYHLVSQLLLKHPKDEVTVLDNFLYKTDSLVRFRTNKRLNVVNGDICNIQDVVKVIKNKDAVVALAAIVGDPACALNEEQTLSTNYHSTHLLIDLCNYYQIKRLIFASSCSVYGAGEDNILLNEGSKLAPQSLYAKTRIMSEEILKKYSDPNLDFVILRLATVFGWSARMRFDLVVNFLCAKAFYTKEIDIIGGDQWRPFIHAADIAKAVILTLDANSKIVKNETFNVGGDNLNYRIKDLVPYIKRYIPRLTVNYKIGTQDKRDYRVSFRKIRELLGFVPDFTVEKGIKEIIEKLKHKRINYLDDIYYNVKYLYRNFKL